MVDAGETAGLVPVEAAGWGADAVVVGGGPVGALPWTGALLVRPGARIHPLIGGGLQEGGKRAGAEDVPGIVALGAAISMTTVLLVFQYGQPRIFFAMARDGLLPAAFARVHPRFRTPATSQVTIGVATALVAGLVPIDLLGVLRV